MNDKKLVYCRNTFNKLIINLLHIYTHTHVIIGFTLIKLLFNRNGYWTINSNIRINKIINVIKSFKEKYLFPESLNHMERPLHFLFSIIIICNMKNNIYSSEMFKKFHIKYI